MDCENCIHYCVCSYDGTNTSANYCSFYEEVRPHGEWSEVFEHLGIKYHKCMACYTGIKLDVIHQNFCPNCGSDNRKRGYNNEVL